MINLESIVNSGFIAVFIALLIGSISYAANNINATPLEKKMMTNFEKIKIHSSVAFIVSFVMVIIIFFILIFKGEIDETPIFTFFLALVILLILIFAVAFVYIIVAEYFTSKVKGKKFDFLITLTNEANNEKEWEVIRMTGSNYLLIKCQEGEEYRLIKDYDNLSIRAIERE